MYKLLVNKISNYTRKVAPKTNNLVFEDTYVPLGKNRKIVCENSLLRNEKYSKIFNENNLGALDNYCNHNNVVVYIDDLNGDVFNDVIVDVSRLENMKYVHKELPLRLRDKIDDFADSMRSLYRTVENAVKELPKNN